MIDSISQLAFSSMKLNLKFELEFHIIYNSLLSSRDLNVLLNVASQRIEGVAQKQKSRLRSNYVSFQFSVNPSFHPPSPVKFANVQSTVTRSLFIRTVSANTEV